MRRPVVVLLALLVVAWALVPAARGVLLVRHGGSPFSAFMDQPREHVRFPARDGVQLSGTLVKSPNAAGTVILVHGFKSGRAEMFDWLDFLYPTYSVLLFDSRGTGSSEGVFGVGATEDRDILGAVDLIASRTEPGSDRIAVLGISLGAGDALLAGAQDTRIRAVVADSPWIDEFVQLERMHSLSLGPVSVPLLPYEPALVDMLIGGRLEDAIPIVAATKIPPRRLLLIHALDDANATTPVAGSQRIAHVVGEPTELWLVPSGGHVGAIGASRDEYVRRVMTFLQSALQ
jgi:dipeptidyl aminopeptidase/acylaminoacyl peptidase